MAARSNGSMTNNNNNHNNISSDFNAVTPSPPNSVVVGNTIEIANTERSAIESHHTQQCTTASSYEVDPLKAQHFFGSELVRNPDGTPLLDNNNDPIPIAKMLATKPLRSELQTRPGPGNKKLLYLSGDSVTRTLNDIFGFDGWCLEIKNTNREECIKDNKDRFCVAYTATVRVIHRRSGAFKEDCGAGDSTDKSLGTAIAHALKASITDALKRAVRHFGDKLGNSLYESSFNVNNAPRTLKDALNNHDVARAKSKFGFDKDRENKASVPPPPPTPHHATAPMQQSNQNIGHAIPPNLCTPRNLNKAASNVNDRNRFGGIENTYSKVPATPSLKAEPIPQHVPIQQVKQENTNQSFPVQNAPTSNQTMPNQQGNNGIKVPNIGNHNNTMRVPEGLSRFQQSPPVENNEPQAKPSQRSGGVIMNTYHKQQNSQFTSTMNSSSSRGHMKNTYSSSMMSSSSSSSQSHQISSTNLGTTNALLGNQPVKAAPPNNVNRWSNSNTDNRANTNIAMVNERPGTSRGLPGNGSKPSSSTKEGTSQQSQNRSQSSQNQAQQTGEKRAPPADFAKENAAPVKRAASSNPYQPTRL